MRRGSVLMGGNESMQLCAAQWSDVTQSARPLTASQQNRAERLVRQVAPRSARGDGHTVDDRPIASVLRGHMELPPSPRALIQHVAFESPA